MKPNKVAVAKFVIKGVLGFTLSAVIGYTVKLERNLKERVDDYYDDTETKPETDQEN